MGAEEKKRPARSQYIWAARSKLASRAKIKDDAPVELLPRTEEEAKTFTTPGAYVQAWIWVPDALAEKEDP